MADYRQRLLSIFNRENFPSFLSICCVSLAIPVVLCTVAVTFNLVESRTITKYVTPTVIKPLDLVVTETNTVASCEQIELETLLLYHCDHQEVVDVFSRKGLNPLIRLTKQAQNNIISFAKNCSTGPMDENCNLSVCPSRSGRCQLRQMNLLFFLTESESCENHILCYFDPKTKSYKYCAFNSKFAFDCNDIEPMADFLLSIR